MYKILIESLIDIPLCALQDMFPITEEYIEREYTIAGNHLMLTSEHTAREIVFVGVIITWC